MEAIHGVANSHVSSPAKAGDPVTTAMLWSSGSPAFAGDDTTV